MSGLDELRQEVLDEVDETGHVGVHELVWSLRTQEPQFTDSERVELAKQVAAQLLGPGGLALYRLQWPGNVPVGGPITLADVAEEDWLGIPESGRYPAFVPNVG